MKELRYWRHLRVKGFRFGIAVRITIYNPAFDVTPNRYIAAIIT